MEKECTGFPLSGLEPVRPLVLLGRSSAARGQVELLAVTGTGLTLIAQPNIAAVLAYLGIDLAAIPIWEKVASHTYLDFVSGAMALQISLGVPPVALAPRECAEKCVVKLTQTFAAPGLASAVIDIGKTAVDAWILGSVDGMALPGNLEFDAISGIWLNNMGAGTALKTTLTCNVALNTLTAGAYDVWLKRSQLPA